MKSWTKEGIADQSGRVVIVTGGNSGIGFEAAKALAEKQATVVLACRDDRRANDARARILDKHANATVHVASLDLADLDSVRQFTARFVAKYDRLDLLINNAGVMMPPFSHTAQNFELQFGVNHLGHFALTLRLLPLLSTTKGSRVVTVSSQAHRSGRMDFDDLNWQARSYDKMAAYGQSKLANLLFTFELQRKLDREGVDVMAVAAHPGWTSTNLQKHSGLFRALNPIFSMSAPQGALPTLFAATSDKVVGGDYIGPDGFYEMRGYPKKVGSTTAAQNQADADRLWSISEELTSERFKSRPPLKKAS